MKNRDVLVEIKRIARKWRIVKQKGFSYYGQIGFTHYKENFRGKRNQRIYLKLILENGFKSVSQWKIKYQRERESERNFAFPSRKNIVM